MRRSNVAGLHGSLVLSLCWLGVSACGKKAHREPLPDRSGRSLPTVAEVREGTAPSAASARPLRMPSLPAGETIEMKPDSPLWSKCAEGFAPSSAPEADVMRIGMACGPVNGLTLLRRWNGAVDENQPPSAATHRWDAERGDCFRVFAVGAPSIEDLEVEVERPHGGGVVLENQNRRWVIVSDDRPFCSSRDGELVARVSTHGGKGAYALAVWRRAKMRESK